MSTLIIRGLQGKGEWSNGEIAGGVFGGGIAGSTTGLYLNWMFKQTIESVKQIMSGEESYSERLQVLLRMMGNVVLITSLMSAYYFGNTAPTKPAAMLAGIPLGTVVELSHAMSMEDLKYRAKGGIFLAHQGEGNESLRISGKAWGANRFIFLIMLDFLFRFGNGKIVDMFEKAIEGLETSGFWHYFPDMEPEVVPWEKFNEYAVGEGKEEYHMTFPVITRQRVYLNMYIETYEFTESIDNGLNCLTYNIFLRKYLPLPPYRFSEFDTEDEVDSQLYGERTYYYKEGDDEFSQDYSKFHTAAEYGLSAALITYRMFLIISGNSLEENIALITSYEEKAGMYGKSNLESLYKKRYSPISGDYSLTGLSIKNKEEMIVDV